jgi:hypothetical protein
MGNWGSLVLIKSLALSITKRNDFWMFRRRARSIILSLEGVMLRRLWDFCRLPWCPLVKDSISRMMNSSTELIYDMFMKIAPSLKTPLSIQKLLKFLMRVDFPIPGHPHTKTTLASGLMIFFITLNISIFLPN